jgi:hypothetical protein
MTSGEPIERKLENLAQTIGSEKTLVENVMKRIEQKPVIKISTTKPQNIWSKIMKSKLTKLAAAAVIVIALLVISFPFNRSGVAWGALAVKIKSVQSVVYHLTGNAKMEMPNIPEEQAVKTTAVAYYSSKYGTRSENYMNDKLAMIMYVNPQENLYLTVIPESKRYMKVTNKTQDELKQISDKDDPRVMVRRIMSGEYKELGRDKINGINVEGIECSGPEIMGGMFEQVTARLWVEVGTDFPVRIEIEGIDSGRQMEISMVMDDFKWNVDLDPALFVPEIPSDYTSQDMAIPEPEINEGTAINALRSFAELTDGRYPQSLAILSLIKEIPEVLTKKYGPEFVSKQDEYNSKLMSVLPAGVFYGRMEIGKKEPAYYGDTVTAKDSGKVLLRWKVSEGVYRVVFADLSAGNFSTEELATLEKP